MLRHTLIGLVTLLFMSAANIVSATPAGRAQLLAEARTGGDYAFSRCRDLKGKPFDGTGQQKKVLIIGDSYACDFLNAVDENAYLQNYQVRLRYIPYACQTIMGEGGAGLIAARDKAFCADSGRADSLEQAQAQIRQADVIIFASRWKPEVAQALPGTIARLGLKPQQKAVVVGNKFFGKISLRQYLRMPDSELKTLENEVNVAEAKTLNAALAQQLAGTATEFIDPHALLCGDDASCPLFTSDLQLISYDGRHLTKGGARYVGKVLFEHSSLGKM